MSAPKKKVLLGAISLLVRHHQKYAAGFTSYRVVRGGDSILFSSLETNRQPFRDIPFYANENCRVIVLSKRRLSFVYGFKTHTSVCVCGVNADSFSPSTPSAAAAANKQKSPPFMVCEINARIHKSKHPCRVNCIYLHFERCSPKRHISAG